MPVCCDYHVHTTFSVDGSQAMAAACQAAVRAGLGEICFTEHVDLVAWEPDRAYLQPAAYLAEIERCRAEFAGQLVIRAGVEAGETHLVAQELQALLAAWPFDFVLGSVHWTDRSGTPLSRVYEGRSPQDVERDYLAWVLDLAQAGDFDSLGHLDLIKRYRPAQLGPFETLAHAGLVRAILQAVARRDKAIEINTSPLRKGLDSPCPDLDALRWFRELGGEKLTLGSDAHRAEHVAAGLELAADLARAAGFTRILTFERRQPRWVTL